ncbi:MAG: peptidoglycan-binding protein [Acidimicrobiales bacterium]
MTIPGLPLTCGDSGEAIADLHRRLVASGFGAPVADRRAFCEVTEATVIAFQNDHKLQPDGVVNDATWTALVEAGYRLGDRRLYHRSPMMRGDDVSELQLRLGSLGFDAGWVDGIFGADTAAALIEFQRNAGIAVDGIAGSDSYQSLERLGAKSAATTTVASLREVERLTKTIGLVDRRIAVGEQGGLAPLVRNISRLLRTQGARVLELHQPDASVQARAANEFEAELFLALEIVAESGCEAHYFSTTGFESFGGRRLAQALAESLPAVLGNSIGRAEGRREPILRETRMPAVACRVGPPSTVVQHSFELANTVVETLDLWLREPLTKSTS